MKLYKIVRLVAICVTIMALAAGCNKSLKQRIEQAKGASEADEYRAKEKAEQAVENEYQDEWNDFRKDAEKQIAENQKSIENLEANISTSNEKLKAEVQSAIDSAAQKNAALKAQLNAYKDDGKVNWDAFKRDVTHDLDALGNKLDHLTVQSKK